MSGGATPVLSVEEHGRVRLIRLQRPEKRNAISAELAQALCDAIRGNQDAGCLVITGADPAFCAGLDLRNIGLETLSDLPPYWDVLAQSEVPMIAAVNGPAVAGGFEIALSCDFIIASERAMFADSHVRLGIYPGPGLVYLPRRVGMAWAREIQMTGNFVDAQTALRIGLVNHVVPHEQVVEVAMRLAGDIAEQDSKMIRTMRQDYATTGALPVADALRVHEEFRVSGGFTGNTAQDLETNREAVMNRSKAARST